MSSFAHANNVTPETWSTDGRTFDSKSAAVKFVIASGKPLEVTHSRCEILTNKLTFKACPKNKKASFENEQFENLTATKWRMRGFRNEPLFSYSGFPHRSLKKRQSTDFRELDLDLFGEVIFRGPCCRVCCRARPDPGKILIFKKLNLTPIWEKNTWIKVQDAFLMFFAVFKMFFCVSKRGVKSLIPPPLKKVTIAKIILKWRSLMPPFEIPHLVGVTLSWRQVFNKLCKPRNKLNWIWTSHLCFFMSIYAIHSHLSRLAHCG